ncbi:MAG: acetyl/propionyl/methylcrotonyl-CoA carboxylase subunit alpha [Leucobacter sp.]
MLNKVLIANRGEIAVRIIRAARAAGIASVAVYADGDLGALHTRLADEAYALVGDSPAESYLGIDKLLKIAADSGADAVHPGYGFLAESAEFAQAVQDAGLIWIGPDPETIVLLGNKVSARSLAKQVGAPLAPGSEGTVASVVEIVDFVDAHGLPIVIKAAYGGGGRGMRVVRSREEIEPSFDAAVREATAAFGRGECLVEKFLDRPRHIEAQVLGDRTGRVAVLGTRDCSLQRRNQKLVEEAPAPFLDDAVRDQVHAASEAISAAAGYVGAGTVEFLLGEDGTLTFLEVNTRLQVEHPVTELVTGIDLVQEQFRIADGLAMNVPDAIATQGHAIEFRINAEDPGLGFLPVPGRLERFEIPAGPGVRVDSGVTSGSTVSSTFDSLLAKLIVWGRDREEALARAATALDEFHIEGVATVLPFHRFVLNSPAFLATSGEGFAVHTRWIEQESGIDLEPAAMPVPVQPSRVNRVSIEIDGRQVVLGLPDGLSFGAGQQAPVETEVELGAADLGSVVVPFAGTVSKWLVDDGATVAEGDSLLVLEAMKMEVPVVAPRTGRLVQLVRAGESVLSQSVLGRVEQ